MLQQLKMVSSIVSLNRANDRGGVNSTCNLVRRKTYAP